MILTGTLMAIIAIAWYLSFSVPPETSDILTWLWDPKNGFRHWMIVYVVLLIVVVGISIMMFATPSITQSESPVNQSGIFLFSSSILLTSNFFISPIGRRKSTYDSHPLIFYTVIFFLGMSFLTAVLDSIKVLDRETIFDLKL